jgi:murein DD-endopeptidase MepM/ murein hydrolase activator NlpD
MAASRRKKPKIVYVAELDPQEPLWEEEEDDVQEDLAPEAPAKEAPASRRPFRGRGLQWVLTAAFALIALVVTAAFIFIPSDPSRLPQKKKLLIPNCLGFHPDIDWGYELHMLECQSGILGEGQSLSDVLLTFRVDYKHAIQLMEQAGAKGLAQMPPGGQFTMMHQRGNPLAPHLFCYEPNPESFVLMNLKGPAMVHVHPKKIIRRENKVTDVIVKTTLAEEMFNRTFGLRMTRDIEEALRFKVDLFHLAAGDRLRLLYTETEYEGGFVDIGKVIGVEYSVAGEANYAFWFEETGKTGYYDVQGRVMKEGFLKAPLEFGRISSPYNPNRPDPVSKSGIIIPHLGTDYAAPEGTPILAVADGTVMEAEFRDGNGNYVKLFHTDSIQTQYLHMSAFAEGIGPGVQVSQGETIGYVGSTGRSTGPHVCFRYWKNGVQVDHRKEHNFTGLLPLKGQALSNYELRRDSLMSAFGVL